MSPDVDEGLEAAFGIAEIECGVEEAPPDASSVVAYPERLAERTRGLRTGGVDGDHEEVEVTPEEVIERPGEAPRIRSRKPVHAEQAGVIGLAHHHVHEAVPGVEEDVDVAHRPQLVEWSRAALVVRRKTDGGVSAARDGGPHEERRGGDGRSGPPHSPP